MHTHAQLKPASRRGITLLEVLMAMFVLAVGILSIFGLFTAGRELEARAAIKSDAIALAGTLRNTIAVQWVDAWRDWLYVEGAGFARIESNLSGSSRVSLPVLIDPCGLSADTLPRSPFLRSETATGWDWSRMTPLNSGTTTFQPFARLTLPLAAGGTVPMPREGALASISDQDAIEYTLPNNDTDPPRNAFELGRRKRGSDLVPALFVAVSGMPALPATAVAQSRLVKRTLLIFHRPATGMEEPALAAQGEWPAGYLELAVPEAQQQPGLIKASLTRTPGDLAIVRRSLRPGNWLLIAQPLGASDTRFDTRWVKIKSATPDDPGWLLVLDDDKTIAGNSKVYAFERLVHVEDTFADYVLP